jgi:tripartite-type tricarboxylate transporter receptor subunit TctC
MRSSLAALSLTGAAFALAGAAGPAQADAVSDFYHGKTVTLLVTYPPGGSYDVYGRLLAEHLPRHIPGKPEAIVQNMPGGGGSLGLNHFYKTAPKDGTMLVLPPDAYAVAQLMTPKQARWDAGKLISLGRIVPVNPVLMVRGDAPAHTLADLKKTEIVVGCTGRSSQSFIMPAMMKHFLGYKWKLICGYKGSAPLTLAMERGEVHAQSSAWASWRIRDRDRITKGELVPVVQFGLEREAEVKDVPLMQELTDDPKIKQVLEFISAGSALGRSLAGPPGMSADRVAALRRAFDETMKDPAFLADAEKRSAQVQPATGQATQGVVKKVLATPPELIKLAQGAYQLKPVECTVNCEGKKK